MIRLILYKFIIALNVQSLGNFLWILKFHMNNRQWNNWKILYLTDVLNNANWPAIFLQIPNLTATDSFESFVPREWSRLKPPNI